MPERGRYSLEIEEDLPLQRKLWTAERIAWAGGAIVIFAAILGLFGSGPLNRVTAGEKGGAVWLDYGRFARFKTSTDLHVSSGDPVSGEVEIFVSEAYLDDVDIEAVSPPPQRVEVTAGGQVFVFVSRGDFSATFSVKPHQIGSLSGTVGLADGERVEFTQFIYP